MRRTLQQRIAFGRKIGLTASQARILARLGTPEKIQDFITAIPINSEKGGETCRSAAEVLKHNKAHCIEASFVAASALWMAGYKPLVMDMQASKEDHDHVITLFKEKTGWGAISKSNHVWLRWRDPIYRDLRELALSYFHEYTKGKNKTLRAYSTPVDLRRFKNLEWVNSKEDCWEIAESIDDSRHYSLITPAQIRALRPRDAMEMKADRLTEFKTGKR
jgi:hypothetical protein